MKKVLVVFTNPFSYNDGATCVMLNYFRNLSLEGIRIDFAGHNDADDELIKEIHHKGSQYYNIGNRSTVISYFFNLYKLLMHYDVLHVNGNSATTSIELLAGVLARTRVRIVHIHNSKNDHPLIHKLLLPFFKLSYNKGLACSTLAGDWIFGAGKFLVLKNSIDIYKFKFSLEARKTVRKSLKIQDDFIVLGHVGMFNEQKNHHKILMVFKAFLSKCPNSRLLLVGDGVLMDEISKEIEKINIGKSVIMTGVRTDIPRLLSAMDIFIFPSKWEGLGLAVIEAQASGLPCLLSDRIPRDVYISDNMKSAALETSSEDWANMLVDMAVEDRDTQSAHNIEKINNAGYNIVTEAGKLKDIYLDIN